MSELFYCPNCNNPINESSNFCTKCGFNLKEFMKKEKTISQKQYCPKCGTLLDNSANFCKECGFNLKEFSLDYKDNQTFDDHITKCPFCKQILLNSPNFCSYCGRKLNDDYEEDEYPEIKSVLPCPICKSKLFVRRISLGDMIFTPDNILAGKQFKCTKCSYYF